MNTTKRDLFDEMSDREFDATNAMDAGEREIHDQLIRDRAHIANGGEAMFPCPACKGTGRWGWSHRPCFKCKSTGKVTKSVAAAAKATVTKRFNIETYKLDNADLIEGLKRHEWNRFVKSMLDQIMIDNKQLTENQTISVRDAITRYDEQNRINDELREQSRQAKSGAVNLNAVHELFAKATSKGLKRPIFRGANLTVKMARRHLNILYVTETNSDTYLGKIVNGEYKATNAADPETLGDLRMICDDPEKALFNYSRSTATYDACGNMISCGCGICGKELTDPESMARGIGPICAGNFGL